MSAKRPFIYLYYLYDTTNIKEAPLYGKRITSITDTHALPPHIFCAKRVVAFCPRGSIVTHYRGSTSLVEKFNLSHKSQEHILAFMRSQRKATITSLKA